MMPDHVNAEEMPEPPDWAEDAAPICAVPLWAVPMEGRPQKTAQVDRLVEERAPPRPAVEEAPEAPKSDIERFRERCEAAGITDDKALYQVMLTLYVASETALATVKSGARGLTPEGEADLIKRISRQADASLRDAVTKHRLRLERKTSLIAGGVVAACLVLGVGGGYWYGWSGGRNSVQVIERQVATAFQAGPDAAGVWLRLMQHNDPRQALEHCTGSAVWSDSGRQACSIPLWIDGPGAPETNRK